MQLHTLLSGRPDILRQAHLSNLALAYATLRDFAQRLARARLAGGAVLHPPQPDEDRPWATLTALDCSQSIVEEHFTDQDLMDLSDVLQFTLAQPAGTPPAELTFRFEEFAARFVEPVRADLLRAGVKL